MASASESRNMTSEETEVTSERRAEGEEEVEERKLDLEFPLMTQSSIYSLTLDQIQNTVCEPGKTFGSMNMDEFLTNIWNVEESQAANAQNQPLSGGGGLPAAPLQRQGSITIPAPMCRKTVDEVWAEIHRGQNARRQKVDRLPPPLQQQQESSAAAPPRQPTLGEMTLEDFLVKAGVVKEGYHPGGSPSPHAPIPPATQYEMTAGYQMVAPEGAQVFGHVVGLQGYGDHQVAAANGMYQVVGDGGGPGPGYAVGSGFGGSVGNGYGGVAAGTSPASPGSSEGMGGGLVDNSGTAECGGEGKGGRKRALDGAVEKVVERRQRRMIKNRESAARSRARKQVLLATFISLLLTVPT